MESTVYAEGHTFSKVRLDIIDFRISTVGLGYSRTKLKVDLSCLELQEGKVFIL